MAFAADDLDTLMADFGEDATVGGSTVRVLRTDESFTAQDGLGRPVTLSRRVWWAKAGSFAGVALDTAMTLGGESFALRSTPQPVPPDGAFEEVEVAPA